MCNSSPRMSEKPSLRARFDRLRGSSIDFDLRPCQAPLSEVERFGKGFESLSDSGLQARSRELADKVRGKGNAPLDLLLPQAYALVREGARRMIGQRPYDVQVLAAIALHQGKVVEMLTGEGKTLAAVMPAFLNALTGKGVHVLTFNDYLARRDAEWMGPIYRFLGLSVGWVQEGMSPAERRNAYQADVTYLTAKEAGFDFLRGQLCCHSRDLVQRPFHCAIVDEADSLLIDEARVPLVLAGSFESDAATMDGSNLSPQAMAELAGRLEPGVDFEVGEYRRNIELTEAGYDRIEEALGCDPLAEENYNLLTRLHCALHARLLLQRDVDYIVRNGRIELVDEFTGRTALDRHWPDGLQEALEAKEGLERRAEGRILGSITLEHFLGLYPRLCGMTGTAQDGADELRDLYNLEVAVIPTHRPMIRIDQPDLVFTHRQAKEKALLKEIGRVHAKGRPVLVGTLTIEESERLAGRLRNAGVRCQVLNAKNDAQEAKIVAGAGALGAVTISTNMAGRGTDIRLGGQDEADRKRVAELGGLYVIGTNRHESRRIDLQLRGRAGRQGDPGESRFFVSLQDDLLQRYGLQELLPAGLLPEERDEPIDNPILRREIARVQRIIEGQNCEIRKSLWRYSLLVEDQRSLLQGEREAVLHGRKPSLWQQKPRYAELVEAVGEQAVRQAERAVALFHVDRSWSEHLALIADLREGIHLVRVGGQDPLKCFQEQTIKAFQEMRGRIDQAVLQTLESIEANEGSLSVESIGIQGPSSTWTYLVNDDPFRDQLSRLLTGPGQTAFGIGAAVVAAPLLVLWAILERYFKKKRRRR